MDQKLGDAATKEHEEVTTDLSDQASAAVVEGEPSVPAPLLIDDYPEFKKIAGNIGSFCFPLDMKPFKNFCAEEIKKAQSNFAMPGFRKGHVPVSIVEKQQLPVFLDRYLPSFLKGGFDNVMQPYTSEKLRFLLDGFELFSDEQAQMPYQIMSLSKVPETLFVSAHFEIYKELVYSDEAIAGINFERAHAELDGHSYHMMVDSVCRTVLMPYLTREERPVQQGDILFCHLTAEKTEESEALFEGKVISVPFAIAPSALGEDLCALFEGKVAGDQIHYTGAFPDTFSFDYLTTLHTWTIHLVEIYSSQLPFADLFTNALRNNVTTSPLFAKMDTASFEEELDDLRASVSTDTFDVHPYTLINSDSLEEGFQAHIDMLLHQINRQKLLTVSLTHLQSVETSYVPMRLVERYATTFFDFLYAWNKMFGFLGQSMAVFPYARVSVAALAGKTHQELLDILKDDIQWFVGKTYFLLNQMMPQMAPKDPGLEELYAIYKAHHHAFVTPVSIEAFKADFVEGDATCLSYLRYLYWEGLLTEWLMSRIQVSEAEPLNSWSLFVMPGFCIL